jgi:hypothetical protein
MRQAKTARSAVTSDEFQLRSISSQYVRSWKRSE